MIRFNNEDEARAYISRWMDEQPSEDIHATVLDFVLLLFGEEDADSADYTIDPAREVGVEFIDHAISNVRSLLEVDELLLHASKGLKAEPGSRVDDVRACALHDTEWDEGEKCEECEGEATP